MASAIERFKCYYCWTLRLTEVMARSCCASIPSKYLCAECSRLFVNQDEADACCT